jgi:hypothetical protein
VASLAVRRRTTVVIKFEDFKAPWEVDAQGNPIAEDAQVVDKNQLKKYLHNVLSDKEKAQIARDTERSKRTELETKVKELESGNTGGGEGKTGEKDDQIQKLMGLVQQLTDDNKKAKFETEKFQILSSKGFDPVADAALFEGKNTAEAVEQYAELLAERGLASKKTAEGDANQNGGQNNQQGTTPRLDGKPAAPLNSGLPNGAADEKVDVNAFLAQYMNQNPL